MKFAAKGRLIVFYFGFVQFRRMHNLIINLNNAKKIFSNYWTNPNLAFNIFVL